MNFIFIVALLFMITAVVPTKIKRTSAAALAIKGVLWSLSACLFAVLLSVFAVCGFSCVSEAGQALPPEFVGASSRITGVQGSLCDNAAAFVQFVAGALAALFVVGHCRAQSPVSERVVHNSCDRVPRVRHLRSAVPRRAVVGRPVRVFALYSCYNS